jgi:hypothetical protein
MAKQDSDYPTEDQIREIYEAYKSKKPGAIAEVLRRRKQEREEARTNNARRNPEDE